MQHTLIEVPVDAALEAQTSARDAEREIYREKLRQHLKDPEFRAIEGFPHATDEAILALSDPPYYTACPNPFLAEWLEKNGKPFDAATDTYSCEPFASDVSEGKNDPIYNAHSYHTKVPHKAIMRYILHYTAPGDVVYDGFCGTGMTGVAAQLCGDKAQVESLGHRVVGKDIFDGEGQKIGKFGARKAILNDLSPAATFIAANYNLPVDAKQFEREAKQLLAEVEAECGWMYATLHNATSEETEALAVQVRSCRDATAVRELVEQVRLGMWEGKAKNSRLQLGRINHVVMSDVFLCAHCGGEIIFWDAAVDLKAKKVIDEFLCPSHGQNTKRAIKAAVASHYDATLNATIQQTRRIPVLLNIFAGGKRHEKKPDVFDQALIEKINSLTIPHWLPAHRMPEGDESRRNDTTGMTHTHHFYTKRNLHGLASCWVQSKKAPKRSQMGLMLSHSAASPYASLMRRFRPDGKGGGPLSGTLYVSSISTPPNVALTFGRNAAGITAAFEKVPSANNVFVNTGSATGAVAPGDSVDYIFTDPPFGGNLMYSELNFLWEAWIQVFTDNTCEAIENSSQHKGLAEYQELMTRCFAEYHRVLKPGRWMTVEFHNSANAVWNSIQEGLETVGFVVADIRVLDKQQGSFKQVTSSGAVKSDLVISCYKPRSEWESRFSEHAGQPEGVVDFLRGHLEMLPVSPVNPHGQLERVAERTRFLLFDRMVAYHLQRSARIPLSAAEFYALLEGEFVERDSMYFLPTQAARYDARRVSTDVEPLSLFVKDERSAVQWLRACLNEIPQTLGDLTPAFMQELATLDSYEERFELRDLLRENFIEDGGVWRVPNPDKERDIEALRRKGLLKTFQSYVDGKGTIKNFRKEAIIEGFTHCWKTRQFSAIVYVAERIPEKILREIHEFTQFYDIAKTRAPVVPTQLEFAWE